MSYPFAVLFLFSKHGLPRPMDRPPVFQHIVYRIHAKPGINKVAMLAERIVLSSRLNRFPQDTVLFTVPSFFQGRFVQIRQIRHFKVVATANSQFPVRHNPHIRIRHQAGFFYDFPCRLLVRRAARPVCQHFFQITHLDKNIHILEFIGMIQNIFIDHLNIPMQFHIQTIIINDQLIHIGHYRFYLLHIKQKPVG